MATNRNCPRTKANIRKKVRELLEQIKVLTPGSVSVRWRIIDMMLKLLLEKGKKGIEYRDAYLRIWEITSKIRKPTSVSNLIRMLMNSDPQILKPLDPTAIQWGPETHFTREGISVLKQETELWKEIFQLTDEYDLLKPLIQILCQRLDEINRYIQGSLIN